jgi:hypothetical protein
MIKKVLLLLLIIFFSFGCTRTIPRQRSSGGNVWGVASAHYEATKDSSYGSYRGGGVATTVSIEKSFGAVGVGGEVGGRI